MSIPEKLPELRNLEIKLSGRYPRISKLFLIISILLIILIVVVAIGILFLELGNNWALLSLEGWMIAFSLLLVIFIVLDLFFYLRFSYLRKKRLEMEKPKPEFINGRKVYVYTVPRGTEGGVYSKTYIEIDNHNILRLRYLMIPPEEIW